MYVFFGKCGKGDVVVTTFYSVYEVYQPTRENAAWADDLGKEVQFSYQGLQLYLGASPTIAPFGHLLFHFVDFFLRD